MIICSLCRYKFVNLLIQVSTKFSAYTVRIRDFLLSYEESKGEESEYCAILIKCVIEHYNLFEVNWTSFNYSSPPTPDFTLAHLVSEQ